MKCVRHEQLWWPSANRVSFPAARKVKNRCEFVGYQRRDWTESLAFLIAKNDLSQYYIRPKTDVDSSGGRIEFSPIDGLIVGNASSERGFSAVQKGENDTRLSDRLG